MINCHMIEEMTPGHKKEKKGIRFMKKKNRISGFIILLLFLCLVAPVPPADELLGAGLPVVTGNPGKEPHHVPKIDSRISVDGVLDEEAWDRALKLELNFEVTPGENIPPPVRTEVFIFHNNTGLCIGFRAYDPGPSAIRARFTDRDKISSDDWVGISLDTFNDQRRIYTFFCNPLGIQADMAEVMGESNTSWDAIWASAGEIVRQGYMVEILIPFRSLRFQRKKGEQVWGFDVVRRYPRNLDHLIGFFPRDRGNECYICQMEKLIGFAGVRASKNIEIDPSFSTLLVKKRENFTRGEWVKKESKLDPGVTAQWNFTPNMMLSTAVNPDFSHVEADVAQLDINTRFALYYPEKRPFFLEGASIFSTPLNVIYTRSLADPDWGIKITGKQGPHALGFFTVRDNVTNLLFPGSQTSTSFSIDKKSTGSVLRYRFDLGKRASTLGFLLTDREGKDYFNRLAGFDISWRFTDKKSVKIQLLGSQTLYPQQAAQENKQPTGTFTGTALDFLFKHGSRNIGYRFYYQQVSPGFRAGLGFMPQVGYRRFTAMLFAASWRNPGYWYTFLNMIPLVEYELDSDNHLIYKEFNVICNYQGPFQSRVQLVGSLGKQRFIGKMFNTNHGEAMITVQPSGSLILQFHANVGNQIDFANLQQGRRFSLNPIFTYRAGRHFSISLDHMFERFNVDAGRLYTANVSNLLVVYQFNRRAFLRAIFQYVNYGYNARNYSIPIDPKFKHLFTQVLFSYKVNPQTVLFLGYSDDLFGFLHTPLTRTNRTFFLKIGYALVL
jgi:hypothetical protein